jgi:hypothetical protein
VVILHKFLLFLLCWCSLASADVFDKFQLESGDLLFQDLNCGKFCDGINSVTYGYNKSYVSHVAMVIVGGESHPQVIEALSDGVVTTPLKVFLNRSLDGDNQPRVMVGRLKPQYYNLILPAINAARSELGKPYNSSFIPASGKSFYCSELIADSFQKVNHNQEFFHSYPMNFNDAHGKTLQLWYDYYRELNTPIPQGALGTNPGMMSRESMLDIVYYYGGLRVH